MSQKPRQPRQHTLLAASFRRYVALGILLGVSVGLLLFLQTRLTAPARAGGAQKKLPAPSLDGGIAWLNTDKPVNIKELKGRVVLLDFWTLCCINCIHTLPDLAKLEAKYPGVLVVIGVHSPKFPNEKKTESIRKAILRYGIKHPVVNDANQAIWKRYEVNSWPTLVLIDPDGNYVGQTSGEGRYEVLDHFIGKLVKEYKAKGVLKEKPLHFQLATKKESPAATPLYFPGKVLADVPGNRLFIADSTHHRIVITDLHGKKIAIAGTGKEGRDNGPFSKATFSDPQGMALLGDMLYVADRKNHVIRALDLKKQTVRLAAGTWEQDRSGRIGGGPALKTGLNSPWDLLAHKGTIYVAMAGHHQVWTFDPVKSTVFPYAGNGAEDIEDGSLTGSSFAQPSGLATDGNLLYVADSETSAIRTVHFGGAGKVRTIVGEGLFAFGDEDGQGSKVRLQHALGVAFRKGKLYIADTYNSKLKEIDPVTRICKTVTLQQAAGGQGPVLNEPGGLSFAVDKLYIADTNSHRIRVVDLSKGTVSTLDLQGVEPPALERGVATKKD
jgi:thiol-disulfide isomerase/thioredoxin